MTLRGWHLDRQQFPASLHLTINRAHAAVAAEFLDDLAESAAQTRKITPLVRICCIGTRLLNKLDGYSMGLYMKVFRRREYSLQPWEGKAIDR